MAKKFQNLRTIPFDIGRIHLVGIGGIGMSGIAEIMYNMGYEISGSDQSENSNVKRLRELGIEIFNGHNAENVKGASVVVKSTAVSYANPEVVAARNEEIPVVKRSEMLAELTRLKATVAVAGSHGKTTTTSILAHLFETAELMPTVINGGIINSYGSNARLGKGDWLIAEADESDGTFIKIPATVGIITNIDPEHMDYWKDVSKIYNAFEEFIEKLPFYGFGVLNKDHEKVREIFEKVKDRKIYTYSMEDKTASCYASNVKQKDKETSFTVALSPYLTGEEKHLEINFNISALGIHNISNALSAITVGVAIGIDIDVIKKAISTFSGVKRRFTVLGQVKEATFVDDYAHHPVEILAALDSAKQYMSGKKGKIIAVMQPHRYTRLEDLFEEFSECFDQADDIIITEMYAAGEAPISGVDQHALARAIKGKKATSLDEDKNLQELLENRISENDLVIFMGAGTITNYAYDIFDKLKNSDK